MESSSGSSDSKPSLWTKEQEFFDGEARLAGRFDLPIIEARYRKALASPIYPLECAYSLMGNVRTKRILDVGCGHGEHSLLFAAWGAEVTGVDVSAGAIDVCRRRAAELNLTANAKFVNAPVESLGTDGTRYDVVWTCAFLHHVLDRLDEVLTLFDNLLHENGRVIFMEPVRMSGWVKRARSFVPVSSAGTPDERPLEPDDLLVLQKHYVFNETSLFGPLSRVVDRSGLSNNYETAPPIRRRLSDGIYRVDRALMRVRLFEPAAMIMVSRMSRVDHPVCVG